MVERKRLGLIFSVNSRWMGGTYYVLNLIYALGTLPDTDQPEIVLLCKKKTDFDYAKKYSKYEHLTYIICQKKLNKFFRIVNKASYKFFKIIPIPTFENLNKIDLDYVFPVMGPEQVIKQFKNIAWIPDLQHCHLPHLFRKFEIKRRDSIYYYFKERKFPIVFSSQDARHDFCEIFNCGETNNLYHIFRFISKPPILEGDTVAILHKYGVIGKEFFLCSNQFWVHKNHKTLFEAIKILKSKNKEILVLCTGGTDDYRNKSYFAELKQYLKANKLEDSLRLLGLIDRNEQLTLMANCKGLIQPSLFEGWNTSVEEAKAFNKILILSDLEVHKEQCSENAIFFKRNNSFDLAEKIAKVANNEIEIVKIDYHQRIRLAAESFKKIILSI